jgi:hypothetical protein
LGHQHNPVRVLLSSVYDIGLPLFIIGLVSGVYLVLRRSRAGLFLFLGAVLPLATIILISPFTQTFSRYIFHTLPCWAILAAIGIRDLFQATQKNARWLVIGLLLVIVADAFSQDVLYYFYQNGNRQDWKGAFQVVEAGIQPGDQVVTTRVPIGEYYLQKPVTWTQGLSPKMVIRNGERTWFVIDDRTGYVSPELDSFLLSKTRLVAVRDVPIPGRPFPMRVYLYDPNIALQ